MCSFWRSFLHPAMAPSSGSLDCGGGHGGMMARVAHCMLLWVMSMTAMSGHAWGAYMPGQSKVAAEGFFEQSSPNERRRRARLVAAARRAWSPAWAERRDVAAGTREWSPLAFANPTVPNPQGRRLAIGLQRRRGIRARRSGTSPRTSAYWGLRAVRVGEASHPGPAAPGTPLGGERNPSAAHVRSRSRSRGRGSSSPPMGRHSGEVEGLTESGRRRSLSPLRSAMRGLGLDESMADVTTARADTRPGRGRRRNPEQGVASRWYCPVPSCPDHDSIRSAGFPSFPSLRTHLGEHAWGRLEGEIPDEFMRDNGLTRCVVCSKILSRRFGNACPRCRPELVASTAVRDGAGGAERPCPGDDPTLDDIFTAPQGCKTHVPKGARK